MSSYEEMSSRIEDDYPYAVFPNDAMKDRLDGNYRPAGKWCMENVGENAFVGYSVQDSAYSPDQAWVVWLGAFRFKTETQAFAFKIAWC